MLAGDGFLHLRKKLNLHLAEVHGHVLSLQKVHADDSHNAARHSGHLRNIHHIDRKIARYRITDHEFWQNYLRSANRIRKMGDV